MLDIYLNPTGQHELSDVDEGQFIGAISFEESDALECIVLHPSGLGRFFHFYEDSYLDLQDISKLIKICISCKKHLHGKSKFLEKVHDKVIGILEEALSKGVGIRTFCD